MLRRAGLGIAGAAMIAAGMGMLVAGRWWGGKYEMVIKRAGGVWKLAGGKNPAKKEWDDLIGNLGWGLVIGGGLLVLTALKY